MRCKRKSCKFGVRGEKLQMRPARSVHEQPTAGRS